MNEKFTYSQSERRPGPNWMERFRVSFSLARLALQETLHPTQERLPSYHGNLAIPKEHTAPVVKYMPAEEQGQIAAWLNASNRSSLAESLAMQQAERIREETLSRLQATDDAPLPLALLDILGIEALDILDEDY